MSPEKGNKPSELELPEGLRIYRERLKEQGLGGAVETVKQEGLGKATRKRVRRRSKGQIDGIVDRARAELHRFFEDLEGVDNSIELSRRTIEASFLIGVIDPEAIETDQRVADIEQVLKRHPDLEAELPEIRDSLFRRIKG